MPILHTSVIILNDDACHVSVLRVSTGLRVYTWEIKCLNGACVHASVSMYTSVHAYAYITSFGMRKDNKFLFSPVVINVEFNIPEYNAIESEQTVMLHLVANGTSSFDYIVTLMLNNISTGE